MLNGPTVYGGYGCDASDPIPLALVGRPAAARATGEEAIVVLQRGPSEPSVDPDNPEPACFPGEKAENAIEAGYDAVLLANHHVGEPDGRTAARAASRRSRDRDHLHDARGDASHLR